jgi:hypothetical protein
MNGGIELLEMTTLVSLGGERPLIITRASGVGATEVRGSDQVLRTLLYM